MILTFFFCHTSKIENILNVLFSYSFVFIDKWDDMNIEFIHTDKIHLYIIIIVILHIEVEREYFC